MSDNQVNIYDLSIEQLEEHIKKKLNEIPLDRLCTIFYCAMKEAKVMYKPGTIDQNIYEILEPLQRLAGLKEIKKYVERY